MAEAKHKGKHGKTVIIVIVAGTGALIAYLWHKDKQQAATATPVSSSGTATAVPATTALNPQEQPNSYASTPVIQNYVSNMSTTNVSSQPVITAFSHKPWLGPQARPTSPHRGGH